MVSASTLSSNEPARTSFSPHITAKTNDKKHISQKEWYLVVRIREHSLQCVRVIESSSLVSVLLEKCLTIPTSPFSFTSK